MDAAEALIAGVPEQAELIRRRYWRDPAFRAVCDDHHAAAGMLARLEREVPPDQVRLAEYRELAAELLREALELLRGETDHDALKT